MVEEPEDIARGFAQAWNQGDADGIAALFADDADFVNVVGLWWRSRERIRRAHAEGFRRIFAGARMTLGRVRVRRLGDRAAVVHATWTLTGQTAHRGREAGARSGVLIFVAEKRDGGWVAVAAQNTDRVPGAETHIAVGGRLEAADYRDGR
ncbi:SgcJ/EcaC family oxidoreductase [Arthrobacter mobilis]|uniref:SgcJ/EcaC family oxidoreductase n=1 Tax=Arthrobacter mobilis TaxID=2724944 RepID=UPI0028AA23B5|nr:SgcJ/EcaC family oxidoreductase [Arthrobacter mobilis]